MPGSADHRGFYLLSAQSRNAFAIEDVERHVVSE